MSSKIRTVAFLFISLACTLVPSSADEVYPDMGITSPAGLLKEFGVKPFGAGDREKLEGLYLLRVGFWARRGKGSLIEVNGSSETVIFRSLGGSGKKIITREIEFKAAEIAKLAGALVSAAPTAPVDVSEAVATTDSIGSGLWLFEYWDPLGGRILMVTAQDLPEVMTDRDHDRLAIAYRRFEAAIHRNTN